jgi:hypothetical protein
VDAGHGVNGIAHEIEYDLLKLDSIPLDCRYRPVKDGPECDAGALKIRLQDNENLFDGFIDLNVGKSELSIAHQGPKANDDVARPASMFDDAHRRPAGFTRRGRIMREPPEASFRAHDDSSQWLIDLVNNGACELAERREAYGSREFIPRVRQRFFRGLSLCDVGDDAFQFDIASWAKVKLSYSNDVQRRAVSMDDPVLVIE